MVRYTLTPLVVTFTVSPSVLPITKSEAVKITLLLASLIFARLAKSISSTVGTIASPVYIFLKEDFKLSFVLSSFILITSLSCFGCTLKESDVQLHTTLLSFFAYTKSVISFPLWAASGVYSTVPFENGASVVICPSLSFHT